jgi:hypothetical protein
MVKYINIHLIKKGFLPDTKLESECFTALSFAAGPI